MEKDVSMNERQVPPIARQPLVRLIPDVNVEVALPMTARLEVVAVCAVKFWRVVEPVTRRDPPSLEEPATSKRTFEVVPVAPITIA